MKLPMYQVDAFSRTVFGGNPAAVVPLESWIYVPTMQSVAAENNLSETAFIVPREGEFEIRWFTPLTEVELCGHATLAAAHVVLRHLDPTRQSVRFASRSGELRVSRDGERLAMELPRWEPTPIEAPPPALGKALGRAPRQVLGYGTKYLCVYDDAAEIAALKPDMRALAALDRYGVIATAPGAAYECDFVSRFFAPAAGVDEDPVTGSAHCLLSPYWSERLERDSLFAKQISKRGGEIWCRAGEKTVTLTGHVAPYFVGEIEV